tara:strand:- start:574 stop:1242 length:669 start_codon:yes stop_codon:yes gene_type:complete
MTKFAVACICVGDKYNINDVKKLEKMVFDNTSLDINFRVFDEPILYKWWNKVLYFSPLIEPFKEDVVIAFDLDILIKNNIDELFEWATNVNGLGLVWAKWRHSGNIVPYEDLKYGLRNETTFENNRRNGRPSTPYNSSIMCWKPNTMNEIWDRFKFEYQSKWPGFDYYVWMDYHTLDKIPNKFYYSAYFENYKDLNYPICLFNQIKNKKEIPNLCPWIKKYE